MKVTAILQPDGTINLTVKDGEFEPAKAALTQALEGLRAEGVDFAEVGEVERHRHDQAHVHAAPHVHSGAQ